jgi:hypothetical protein
MDAMLAHHVEPSSAMASLNPRDRKQVETSVITSSDTPGEYVSLRRHSGTLAQASVSTAERFAQSDGPACRRRITDAMLRTLAIGCVVCASVLAGCGGSHPVPDSAEGYLYRYGSGESFLQWHRDGQKFHGTISETSIAGVAPYPARLIEKTSTVSGTILGSSVFFNGSNGVRWYGTLHSYGLLMVSEQPSGAPINVRYPRASGADYNAAVAQTKEAFRRQRNG